MYDYQQMGTSMGNSVFPEEVMGGLRRWRAKAKKNLATRRGDFTTRSLDASVDSSPSFATLSVDMDLDYTYTSDDDGIVSAEPSDEDSSGKRVIQQQKQKQKVSSFEGFAIRRE